MQSYTYIRQTLPGMLTELISLPINLHRTQMNL